MASSHVPRRSFLLRAGWLGLSGTLVGATHRQAGSDQPEERAASPGFPHQDPMRVRSVVGASHSDLARVRELVTEQPALAKASWDWGFGDWETALGAASHTGRREIAAFLIAHGARPTVFSATMLGDLEAVRGFLETRPELYRLHGPHGIPLISHARAGGAEAESVVDYLLDRFGEDDRPFGVPGDDQVAARYGGAYRFDTTPPLTLTVGVGGMTDQWLMVGTERPTSRVLEVERDVFHPTGAPAVRLRFQVEDGRAAALTVRDGPVVLTGRRVEEENAPGG